MICQRCRIVENVAEAKAAANDNDNTRAMEADHGGVGGCEREGNTDKKNRRKMPKKMRSRGRGKNVTTNET